MVELINWCGVLLLLLGGFGVTIAVSVRRASVWIWVASVGAGLIFLTYDSEVMAITSWLAGTLIAILFYVFSRIFEPTKDRLSVTNTVVVVLVFTWMTVSFGFNHDLLNEPSSQVVYLKDIGSLLESRYFYSIVLLALAALLGVVGVGILGRPEGPAK